MCHFQRSPGKLRRPCSTSHPETPHSPSTKTQNRFQQKCFSTKLYGFICSLPPASPANHTGNAPSRNLLCVCACKTSKYMLIQFNYGFTSLAALLMPKPANICSQGNEEKGKQGFPCLCPSQAPSLSPHPFRTWCAGTLQR